MFLSGSVFDQFDDRITALGGAISVSLEGRLSMLEEANLIDRMAEVESDIDDLEAWRTNKASAISDLTYTVTNDSIAILGIQVPTASSFSGHTTALNSLKDKVNSILSVLRNREIIVA